MTVTIEATETNLTALLEQIEHGDEVQLTKNGQAVARIVPHSTPSAFTPVQRARALAAVEDMKALRNELKLGPFDFEQFKKDRDEDRP